MSCIIALQLLCSVYSITDCKIAGPYSNIVDGSVRLGCEAVIILYYIILYYIILSSDLIFVLSIHLRLLEI